jgi:L-gulonolactone oxidase
MKRFRNWARNQQSRPSAYHQPGSEAEVVALVNDVASRGESLRLVGAGHSWSDIVCTDGHLVNLDRMSRVLAVDQEKHQVTVEAGIRLHALITELADRGLALSNVGSVVEQSIAGALSTGTHGSGIRFGNLATQVIALRLIGGDSSSHDLSSTKKPELFRAARVSLGCLGIVTQVTLQCEPLYDLEEHAWPMPFDEAMESLQKTVDDHEHVKFWWLPHTNKVQAYCANRSKAARRMPGAVARWFDDSLSMKVIYPGLLRTGRLIPAAIGPINRMIGKMSFNRTHKVDRYDRILTVPMPPRHLEIEFAIDRDDTVEALTQVREMIRREGLRVNFVCEVRFVAGDDGWMSPAYGRDTCQIGGYMYPSKSLDAYFEGFEAIMVALGGRPHWGKDFLMEGDGIRRCYPEYERFAELRRQLDPTGVFENGFIRRLFPG